MMLPQLSVVAGLIVLTRLAHAAGLRFSPSIRSSVPAFDGQYVSANANNTQAEWWYAQATAPSESGAPPANVIAVFEQGYIFSYQGGPELSLRLSGTFLNGTNFYYVVPVSSSSVTFQGEAVTGVFTGGGTFHYNTRPNTFIAQINVPGLASGSITLVGIDAPHFACGGPDADPYLTAAVPSGISLSASEKTLFTQLGWPVAMTGGHAMVDLQIEGSPLSFTGTAYHDHNFAPAALDAFVSQWHWVSAQVGPFEIAALLVQATDSAFVVAPGYLARDGAVLQEQCSVGGSRKTDLVEITPWGERVEDTGDTVPAGLVMDFVLGDESRYQFNLTMLATNPGVSFFYRWTGSAVGGGVGGRQYIGPAVYEWINPSLTPYTPS